MKLSVFILASLLFFSNANLSNPSTQEESLLKKCSDQLKDTAEKLESATQKKCLENAKSSIDKALDATRQGKDREAKDNKKKALKWVVQAIRECMAPGEIPGLIGESLKNEGGLDADGLDRLNTLIGALLDAKKERAKSDFPFYHDMAIQQITLALFSIIDNGGFDGWRPEKAINWYIEAAINCQDVQELINKLLDYMGKNKDKTGIPDISPEACQKAKDMLDRLYKMKKDGASFEEIVKLGEEIKKFLDDEGTKTGRLRSEKDAREAEKVEKVSLPVTAVHFTAIDGKTNINKDFVGEVETIKFFAVDGKEIKSSEVKPGFSSHSEHLTVDIKKVLRIASVSIIGTGGIVNLVQDRKGGAPSDLSGIQPKEGVITSRNNSIKETLNVERGAIDMTDTPQSHSLSINGQSTNIVATREGQIAVAGNNIKVPVTGTSELKLVSPDGRTLTSESPSWGYEISMPEITKTNIWQPVSAVVYGLEPGRFILFRFIPQPGQTIKPLEVVKPSEEFIVPSPVAEIMVDKPGPQMLNIIVELQAEK